MVITQARPKVGTGLCFRWQGLSLLTGARRRARQGINPPGYVAAPHQWGRRDVLGTPASRWHLQSRRACPRNFPDFSAPMAEKSGA